MPVCEPCKRQQHDRCDGCLVCQHRTPQTPPPGGDDPATSNTPEKEHNA